jgi:hypothetical protein
MCPWKQGTEREMLDHGEFRKDFCVIHFYHALIDFGPSGCDTGYIEENWGVFPEWTAFDVVDEAYG